MVWYFKSIEEQIPQEKLILHFAFTLLYATWSQFSLTKHLLSLKNRSAIYDHETIAELHMDSTHRWGMNFYLALCSSSPTMDHILKSMKAWLTDIENDIQGMGGLEWREFSLLIVLTQEPIKMSIVSPANEQKILPVRSRPIGLCYVSIPLPLTSAQRSSPSPSNL